MQGPAHMLAVHYSTGCLIALSAEGKENLWSKRPFDMHPGRGAAGGEREYRYLWPFVLVLLLSLYGVVISLSRSYRWQILSFCSLRWFCDDGPSWTRTHLRKLCTCLISRLSISRQERCFL